MKKWVFGVNGVATDTRWVIIYYTLIRCSSGVLALTRNTCVTSCPTGSIAANGMCGCSLDFNQANCVTACPHQCAVCTEFTAGTVSCAFCRGIHKRIWADVGGGNCLCYTGYFDDGSSPECQTCNPTCRTCSNPTDCLSCDPAIRSLAGTQCNCIVGFSFGSSCLPCDITCRSCSGASPNNCLSCDPSTRTLASGLCLCNTGTFSVVGQSSCAACLASCFTCANAFSCSTCEGVLARRVINSVQACVCEVGYYDDAVNPSCVKCDSAPYFCQSCLLSTCLTCGAGDNRALVNRYCACTSGFYSLGQKCIPCHRSCSACSSYTDDSCLSCTAGRFLSNSQCVCSPGQVLVGAACQDCHASCLACSGPS